MSKKCVQKTGAVFALCVLLLLTLLTGGGNASAQNVQSHSNWKPAVSVVNAKTVAPHQSVVVLALCPSRYRAQSGQVKVFHPGRPNIFFLSRNAFAIQASEPLQGRRGWAGRVLNRSGLTLRVQVTATCVL